MDHEEIRRRFETLPGEDYVPPARPRCICDRLLSHVGGVGPLVCFGCHATPEECTCPGAAIARRKSAPKRAAKGNSGWSDSFERCVVPACWVWSRVLDGSGMCPSILWDLRHFAYAKQLIGKERAS